MTCKPTRALAPVLLASAVALSGCISLLPKTKPAQLYRFGPPPAATAANAPPALPASARFAVHLAPLGFPIASASDRILTIDGDRAAYIGGGRWLTSAVSLFEAAVVQTFDARGGAAHLLARGELAPAAYVLKLDVRRFEARYEQGPDAAPTIAIEVYAALDSGGDTKLDREHMFVARVPAGDNRMGAIATAFDVAVGRVCADIADWVSARGAG